MVVSVTSWFGGNRFRQVAPAVLAVGLFLATTGQAAHQDAASLMEQANIPAERWRAMIVSAPYGSIHPAKIAMPVRGTDIIGEEPLGIRFTNPTTGDTVILEPDTDPAEITGSIGSRPTGNASYPIATREFKDDLLMSRAGVGSRIQIDEETGLLRMPRTLIEPPRENLPRTSFMRQRPPREGHPIRLASLSADHIPLSHQPILLSPLEAVARRKIDQRQYARDLHCMATAIYFEARGEPERGQRAVAQVVVNRVADHRYPDSVCGVVYQNKHMRNRCQFSFACDGKPERVNDQRSWALAMTIAEDSIVGEHFLDEVGGSTHYHANYVNPRWSRALRRMDRIGRHIFYKLRPGQT